VRSKKVPRKVKIKAVYAAFVRAGKACCKGICRKEGAKTSRFFEKTLQRVQKICKTPLKKVQDWCIIK
jgi:hypothetical protein